MPRFMSPIASFPVHLKEIGLITVNFAVLEEVIAMAIAALLDIDAQRAAIVTAELSFRNALALLSSLYRARTTDPALVDQFDSVLAKVTQAERQRNVIIHSTWGWTGSSDGTITRMKSTAKISKGLKHQTEHMTAEQLHAIADSIGDATSEVLDWLKSLQPPTSNSTASVLPTTESPNQE